MIAIQRTLGLEDCWDELDDKITRAQNSLTVDELARIARSPSLGASCRLDPAPAPAPTPAPTPAPASDEKPRRASVQQPAWAVALQNEVAGNQRLHRYNDLLVQFGSLLYALPRNCDVFIRENPSHRGESRGAIHRFQLKSVRPNGDLFFESPTEPWRRTTLKLPEMLEMFLSDAFYPDRVSVVLEMIRTVKNASGQGKYEKCQMHYEASCAMEKRILDRLADRGVVVNKSEPEKKKVKPIPQNRKPGRTFAMGFGRKKTEKAA